MKLACLAAVAATALFAGTASAQTVTNTSLQDLNGPVGVSGNSVATTTDATGTRTTVSGPNMGSSGRASGTPGAWVQSNVGSGGTVGITKDYARSGNGSAYFASTGTAGKADLETVFAPIALSTLTSYSYDYFRSAAGTTSNTLAPVLRFDMLKDGRFAGQLVWENAYQVPGSPPAAIPGDTWLTGAGDLNTGIWYASNAALGITSAAVGGTKTLNEWIAGNSGSTLTVYGINLGIGSGWTGNFSGAADNVAVNFAGKSVLANFEVAAAGVPEPATWAIMIAGFGLAGGAMRRRRSATLATA